MDIADPAVVRLLNPNQYTEESVFAAEDSEIPGAGEAAGADPPSTPSAES